MLFTETVEGDEAFLPIHEPGLSIIVTIVFSPECFFVRNAEFSTQLRMLEKDLAAHVKKITEDGKYKHKDAEDIEIDDVLIGEVGDGFFARVKVWEDKDEGKVSKFNSYLLYISLYNDNLIEMNSSFVAL